MPEKPWKYHERRVARLLNCRRNPSGDPEAPDIENSVLAGEVKVTQELPKYLVQAVQQAKLKAKNVKLPIVALVGATSPLDLVVIDLRDYRDWYVGVPRKEKKGKPV